MVFQKINLAYVKWFLTIYGDNAVELVASSVYF
jgi:hypothetical protein